MNTQKENWDRQLQQALSPEKFRALGYQVVDLLTTYLTHVTTDLHQNIPVLPNLNPDQLYKEWAIDQNTDETPQNIIKLFKKVIAQSQHLHHPCYMGHQVASPLPIAALSDFVVSFLNSPSAIYEMGPVHTVIELQVINWLIQQVGYSETAGGFLTSGGSLGNLTALLAAREIKCRQESTIDIKKQGIMFSSQTHYSEIRALRMMGIEDIGAIVVPVDNNYQLDITKLEYCYKKALKNNIQPFAIVANACSTATGRFDNLNYLADFCEKYNIWLHVDGAHGASTVLSDKYRYLVDGIQRADSIVWDLHKMLMMPSLATAVLFKNNLNSYKTFTQEAAYILDKNETIVDDKYIPLKRTVECTKNSMGVKFYISLCCYGKDFFADRVTFSYDLAREFANLIKNDDEFELAVEPQSNIICFRYLAPNVDQDHLNLLHARIQKGINKSGKFYLVKTTLDNKLFLRVSLMNPLTTIHHIENLIKEIKNLFEGTHY